MTSTILKQFLTKLKQSGGSFATEWNSFTTLLRESSDLLCTLDQNNDTSNISTTTIQIYKTLKTALFDFQVCFDPISGNLWEKFFGTMYFLLKTYHSNTTTSNNNNAMNIIKTFIEQEEHINNQETVAHYFRFCLSLPIGENSLRQIFLMIEKFSKFFNTKNTLLDLITSSTTPEAKKRFFTKMTLAIAYSREETTSWPLRTASSPSSWLSVVLRRLQNPLAYSSLKFFFGFVNLPLKQMMVEHPKCELTHLISFLVLVLFAERQNTNSATNKFNLWKDLLVNSLRILSSSGDDDKNTLEVFSSSSSKFVPSPKMVSEFPAICSMIELVSAFSSLENFDEKNSTTAENLQPVFSAIVSRLKKTTEKLCESISEEHQQQQQSKSNSSSSSSEKSTITFSWLLNLWIAIAADFFINNNKTPSQNLCSEEEQKKQNKAISSIVKDMKKSFRLPGKMATEAESGDALFFSEWATAEQLLFGETKLQPEIFKQAVSVPSSQNDPTGTPILVRAAAQLFQSQRAEGAAGTVLERAVDRSSFSGSSIVGTPLGVDQALWSAFSDFVVEQNSSFSSAEQVEQRKRHALYASGSYLSNAPVEETTRRVNPTPSDIYLWNVKQLSLGGGLVLPSSGAFNGGAGGGDLAWATLFRDVEAARRSSVTMGETGGGSSLPTRLPMQNVTGFPSLQDFGANPARLPLPSQNQDETNNTTSRNTFVMPEFMMMKAPKSEDSSTTSTSSINKKILWSKLNKMPENPEGPIRPNCPPENLNEVTGPQRLHPLQRFVADKTTTARIEREQVELKSRSRRELLQSLASEALLGVGSTTSSNGASSSEDKKNKNNSSSLEEQSAVVQMLESLPDFLLKLTKSSIVANTTLQQMELEDSLTVVGGQNRPADQPDFTNSKYVGGFRVPTTEWVIERMQQK